MRASELEPESRALLDRLAAERAFPSHAVSVEHARASFRELTVRDERPEIHRVRDIEIRGPDAPLPLRVYRPASTDGLPALLFFHGGGWIRGDLETHDELCRLLSTRGNHLVISVGYRRAPEHPFPRPLLDCYAATEWTIEHADILGIDPDRVAVGGDSAGGNLAAAVALLARDFDGPDIDHQLLIYPVTDHRFDTDSYEQNARGYLLTRQSMKWYWSQYLRDDIDGRHPYASVLQARSLEGLPPATVIVAGFDPLRDEGVAYAERLREAGVEVELTNFEDTIHGFVTFPDLQLAQEAIAAMADRLGEFESDIEA